MPCYLSEGQVLLKFHGNLWGPTLTGKESALIGSRNVTIHFLNQWWASLSQGLTLSIWFTCPSGTWFWKFTCPAKIFTYPANICTSPVKAYVHGWENKYMPRLKNHLPSRARNHKSLCALRKDLHAPGMQAHLNVEPCIHWLRLLYITCIHCIMYMHH